MLVEQWTLSIYGIVVQTCDQSEQMYVTDYPLYCRLYRLFELCAVIGECFTRYFEEAITSGISVELKLLSCLFIYSTLNEKYSHSLMSLSMYFSAKFFVLRFTIRSREYCRRRDEIHCIKSAIIVLKKILIPTIQPVFPSMVAPFVATTTKYKQLKHIFSVIKHFIPSLGLLHNNSYESDLNHFENKWSMHVTGSMILGNRMHFACFL